MANRMRGQVEFSAGGTDYTLQFTTNSLCELEDKSGGLPLDAFLKKLGGGGFSLKAARLLLWVGLLEFHPDITEKEAGALIDEMGGLEGLLPVLESAVEAMLPEDKKPGNAKPPAAKARPKAPA